MVKGATDPVGVHRIGITFEFFQRP